MEAFSDGVIAILITIMVLEIRIPSGTSWHALGREVPLLLAYLLSFVFLGIYWNNHHHMLMTVKRVDGASLWANLHLLFWLSLVPFASGWIGEHPDAPWPAALYGVLLLMAGVAWLFLVRAILAQDQPDAELSALVADNRKARLSTVLYLVAIAAAFVRPWLADAIYAAVALLWIVPDRRIEAKLRAE
jgi:uncharacterized membrane protein